MVEKRRYEGAESGEKAKKSARERALAIAARISNSAPPTEESAAPGSLVKQNFSNALGADGGFEVTSRKIILPESRQGINYVGLLIGPKAKTLQNLQQQTGCMIQIRGQSKNGQPSDEAPHVFIQGSDKQKLDNAVSLIEGIITDPEKAQKLRRSQMGDADPMSGFKPLPEGSISTKIRIPNNLAGAVIGKGGEQIKSFQQETGARIQIDNSPEAQNPANLIRNLLVDGTQQQIDRVDRIVNDFVVKKQTQLGHRVTGAGRNMVVDKLASDGPDMTMAPPSGDALSFPCRLKIEVPDNKVGLIIGKQGKTINRIHSLYGCKIDIPKTHDEGKPNVRTLLVGAYDQKGLDMACSDLTSIVKYGMPASQVSNQFMNIGDEEQQEEDAIQTNYAMKEKYMETVLSDAGKTYIAQVEQFANCKIDVPTQVIPGSESRTLVISGDKEYFDYVCEQLDVLAASIEDSLQKNDEKVTAESQKYTREQWKQWREYYMKLGHDLPEEAPSSLQAENYDQ